MTTAFGNRFRGERIRRKQHQDAAGRECGVKQSTVCRWERGEMIPEQKHFPAVAKYLGISETELYELIYQAAPEEPKPPPAVSEPKAESKVKVKVFTVDEVAEMMRVSETTVKKWVTEGALPGAFKIGGVWRIRKRDFLRWLKDIGKEDEDGK